MAKIEKQTGLEGDKGREREDEKGTSRVKKKKRRDEQEREREALPFAQFARTQEQIFLDIHKSGRHFKTRGPRGGSRLSRALAILLPHFSLSFSVPLPLLYVRARYCRVLSHRLVLSPFLFLSVFWRTRCFSQCVCASYICIRVVFGVEDTQESTNTNVRSIAHVPRGSRYFMSPVTRAFLYIVVLLAWHASIERQKQTGSETGGCIVLRIRWSWFKRLCDLSVSPRLV